MRWVVTLELPHEAQPHSHIDVGNPEEAAKVVRAAIDATGRAIGYSIAEYEGEWRCSECSAWRLEVISANLRADRSVPVRSEDALSVDE